jgi:hypothetical protein
VVGLVFVVNVRLVFASVFALETTIESACSPVHHAQRRAGQSPTRPLEAACGRTRTLSRAHPRWLLESARPRGRLRRAVAGGPAGGHQTNARPTRPIAVRSGRAADSTAMPEPVTCTSSWRKMRVRFRVWVNVERRGRGRQDEENGGLRALRNEGGLGTPREQGRRGQGRPDDADPCAAHTQEGRVKLA